MTTYPPFDSLRARLREARAQGCLITPPDIATPRFHAMAESVLGPMPQQPSMSAFSFPGDPSTPSASIDMMSVGLPVAEAPKAPPRRPGPPGPPKPSARVSAPQPAEEEDDSTVVSKIPQEVMALATGEHKAVDDDTAEWPLVFEDFLKLKRSNGEPTEGLTFDKFRTTLVKNRDALVARHGCKRVKFTVYVKDGKAALKASPVKD